MTPQTDQYYLGIAHDLPATTGRHGTTGSGIGYGPKGAWNN